MTRIKVCGLTREEDVRAALNGGADMLGFIHVPNTPRFVGKDRLGDLLNLVGDRAQTVIVVRNARADTLDSLCADLNFNLFQFHGDEPPEHLARWPGYKVFHMRGQQLDPEQLTCYGSPFLLDTQVGTRQGGTGKTFDWKVLPHIHGDYLVAGGLTVENVSQLVSRYHPWGVDVSSSIEAQPGHKDPSKLKQFIENVRSAST